jgi:hypothetical protein
MTLDGLQTLVKITGVVLAKGVLLLAGFQKAILFSLQSLLDIPAQHTFNLVRWFTITIITRFGYACGY